MTRIAPDDVLVLPEPLHTLVKAIFEAAGWSSRDAGLAADHLVLSNLSGHDSHGVGMVPRYILSSRKGLLKRGDTMTTVLDSGALLTLDGGMGLGQVVGFDAMNLGIERARRHGVAIVSLRNTHHLGRIGHWGEQVAAAGFVSIHHVNVIGRPALVAPWGGTEARFSTNPVCIAYPRGEGEPIVLDFATSRIAHGKTRVAWKRGVPVADGNLLDAAGNPTNDPAVMWTEPLGALLPFGDHKGYGLAFVGELLAGALSGAGTLPGRTDWGVIDNNMLSILIDPARLGGASTQAGEAERLVEWVKSARVAGSFDRVRIPGEPERETRAARGAQGIPLDATSWGEIIECAVSLGMDRTRALSLAGVSG
ncbi:MAG: malate/lactate/ureidoglycolate dehydrogenase [Betaproteobacteria bacterium]|nr:malate/lactate/ureidoglycolate dehydrogenase [Betaproteobacteria bacterium]